MTRRLLFQPEARTDISEAAHRYEQERPGLGERFVAELDESLARITMAPSQFRILEEGIRRCAFPHFPYAIYFSLDEPRVVVVAVTHRRRDPNVWKRRI